MTINVTEQGDTPTVRNGTGASTTVQNTVTLTVSVEDTAAQAIPYARVRIENASTGTLISAGIANQNGVYVDSGYSYSGDLGVNVVVRKNSPGDQRYLPVTAPATITSSGLSLTISMIEDANAGLEAPEGVMLTGARSEDESGDSVARLLINIPDEGRSRKLVVGAMYWGSGSDLTVSSMTYDGNAMTNESLASVVVGSGPFHELRSYRYDLPDADAGEKEVVVTWSANVALKAMVFAIVDDVATGAADGADVDSGNAVTTNPNISLNPSAPAWCVGFVMVDDTDSPSATGQAVIKRSDLHVDQLKMLGVMCADRAASGAFDMGMDYGANSKTWVAAGLAFLKN